MPTDAQMLGWRGWYERHSLPFVADACGAIVLDVEESDHFPLFRRVWLVRAGLVGSVMPQAHEWGSGVEFARDRRRATPWPDVIILCRLQLDAGKAIREVEREDGLPRVPIIVAGGRPVDELLECARSADADAVLRMPVRGPELVEAVVRLGWPDEFAAATEALALDPSQRPWPEGTASVR